jgi:hypothetical protein
MIHAARMLIVAGVVVSAAPGCGDQTLDGGKVEDYLRDHARVPQVIAEVDCPDGRDAREGDTFECTISLEGGGEETATLRQVDGDGGFRIVGYRQTKLPPDRAGLTIIPENVEAYIRGNADSPERILSVDCPASVPLAKGRSFECVVRYLDRTKALVEITQVDELGNVKIAGG